MRIDDSIKDKEPEYEIKMLHPMCYSRMSQYDWEKGFFPIFIWCNKCKDERECIMRTELASWIKKHVCQPKCRHGLNVYRTCWKCKWFGWL